MYILFPGRHHLLTEFQFKYLFKLIYAGLEQAHDVTGKKVDKKGVINAVVFAVTSANHSNTKRNPIPFYLRAMMIQEFCKELPVPCYVYGIDDVGKLGNFATYTIKQIKHQSDKKLDIKPDNTLVMCSTPVMDMYESLGYTILPAELKARGRFEYQASLPWDLVEMISKNDYWEQDYDIMDKIHPASFKIWKTYRLGEKVKSILGDPIIGDDGDITESRNYNTYVRQMDEIAGLKYKETAAYIQSGRIGDIGCAVGSWIKLASEDARFVESDFYGIEVARQLYDICTQRKHNGEFANPNVFFAQKNAVTSLVFEPGSMDTIHTSSLTHEIESYGGRGDLLAFIKNRFDELVSGGAWINRDVIGPDDGQKMVYLWLNDKDGRDGQEEVDNSDPVKFVEYLEGLSTFARFKRFAEDFRKEENDQIAYQLVQHDGGQYAKLKLKDACEFMLTKDYTDNWKSEMHERFCFWGLNDWIGALEKTGFEVLESSRAYTNPWIVENRFKGKVALFGSLGENMRELPYPPTNALTVARRTE